MIQLGKGLSLRCPSPAPPHELVRKATLCYNLREEQGMTKLSLWEIILRDLWGDTLRSLVTPYRHSTANARA